MAKWWKFILFNSSNLPPRRLDQSVTIDHVDLDSDFDDAHDAQLRMMPIYIIFLERHSIRLFH